MVSPVPLRLEHLNLAVHTNPADQPSEDSRSQPRRVSALSSTSGLLGTRFDMERPLYLKGNEFTGGPNIVIDNGKGRSRPADEGDYRRRPITASESRGSEEGSSIHRVEDLGFKAAATSFPLHSCELSVCDSVISNSLEAVFEVRKLRRSSYSHKPTGSACTQSRLRKEVAKALDWSQFDRAEYLPLDSFESIFTIEALASLLDETFEFATDKDLQEMFASIVDRKWDRTRRRILGVLVFMSKAAYIEHFVREDIWDDQLPLERLVGGSHGRITTRDSKNHNLMVDWSRDEIELFCLYQKMFFIPFFDIKENRLCSYDLELNIRLPWKVFEHKTNGGFGVVHKVEIHPSHHNHARSDVSPPIVPDLSTDTEFCGPCSH